MTSYHVYQGAWRNHYESWWNQFVLTVSDTRALIITAVIGLVLSFVGSQGWIIVRHSVLYLIDLRNQFLRDGNSSAGLEMRPVPAEGGDINCTNFEPDGILPPAAAEVESGTISSSADIDLEDISQRDAILLCFGSRRKLQRHRHMLERYVISPEKRCLIGFIACWTPCCGKVHFKAWLDKTLEAKRAARYFHDCLSPWATDKVGCGTLWTGNDTPETRIYNTSCPFGLGTCLDGVSAVAFEQKITPESLGYNTPSKVSLHRRLTCAPLNLSPFTLPRRHSIPDDKNRLSFFDPEFQTTRNIEGDSITLSPYWLWLDTDNRPSEQSLKFSGWDGYRHRAPFHIEMKLDVIPRYKPANRTFAQAILNPRLRVANAKTFMMVFFAGHNAIKGWNGPILDPVFKSTRELNPDDDDKRVVRFWLPDHEATGIVCAEQFKLCARENACSAWRSGHEDEFGPDGQLYLSHMDSKPLEFPAYDQWLLFQNIFHYSSVFSYLDESPQFLLAPTRKYGRTIRWINPHKQWTLELAALFEASFLRARFSLVGSALKIYDDYNCANNPNQYTEDPVFCRSFLFPAANYTNVNLLSLIVVCVCAFAMLGLSFSIEMRRRPSHASGHVARVKKACRAGYHVLGRSAGRVVHAAISAGKLFWRRGFPAIPRPFALARELRRYLTSSFSRTAGI
ncbi:hypothetical protein QBC37DRAFT_452489 [Rhypophila decipiens]|uniref:Uncharacterized protein n=1 Tax=Rhypophila decipiens TaxID=261697 RepID=A0AAN7B546_9PEZI|nr:hypothetical protein QBC37DRAFT_452489 [Rhypophila decipiens]